MIATRISVYRRKCDQTLLADERAIYQASGKTQRQFPLSSVSRFKRCDLRSLDHRRRQSAAALRKQIGTLKPNEGLILIASFWPASLIEEFGQTGFVSRIEPGQNGDWFVWLWREST